jgi:hypothetical protein
MFAMQLAQKPLPMNEAWIAMLTITACSALAVVATMAIIRRLPPAVRQKAVQLGLPFGFAVASAAGLLSVKASAAEVPGLECSETWWFLIIWLCL